MSDTDKITAIHAREILSGSGRPTVEVDLCVGSGIWTIASVPSGTSTGRHEAVEVVDGGDRYEGRGVRRAVENVNGTIAPALLGKSVLDQSGIDRTMLELDGTANKSHLGANAILGVSIAGAKAAAKLLGLPTYRYVGGLIATSLPVPIATVLAGGPHAPNSLGFEDYILVFVDFDSFADALEAVVTIRRLLTTQLEGRGLPAADVGGALAPSLSSSREAFEIMHSTIERAGYAGRVLLGVDVAATGLWNEARRTYRFEGAEYDAQQFADLLVDYATDFQLVFIEDPFTEDDFESHADLTTRLPRTHVVGDDLFATQVDRLRRGAKRGACNSLLFKVNQVGTLTEALSTAHEASSSGYDLIVSLRSSDTSDDFIADIAVGIGAAMIKLGSPVRGERVVKYNRLLAIEEELAGRGALTTLRKIA